MVLTAILEWILEQTKAILHCQNLAAELVDGLLRNLTLLYQLLTIGDIVAVRHIHIEVGQHTLHSGILTVCCGAVCNHLVYCSPIRHNETLEAELLAEKRMHKPSVTRSRNAHKVVERRHYGHSTCIQSRLVRWEVAVAEHKLRHIYGVVVTTCLRCAVSSEVLNASGDSLIRREILALIASYHCGSNLCTEVWIFARALRYTTPTRVCRNVAHRRECPMVTDCSGLLSCDACILLNCRNIPRTRHTQVLGECDAATVDDVVTEDKRNTQTALVYGNLLHLQQLLACSTAQE